MPVNKIRFGQRIGRGHCQGYSSAMAAGAPGLLLSTSLAQDQQLSVGNSMVKGSVSAVAASKRIARGFVITTPTFIIE